MLVECRDCLRIKPMADYYLDRTRKHQIHPYCRPCTRARRKARYQRTATPMSIRDNSLWQRYGITGADFDSMLEAQGGRCLICSEAPPGKQRLCVDHCHATGVVRGLLCRRCNTLVGFLEMDTELLRAAQEYIGGR